MTQFTVARNAKTSLYEIHKEGCAHTNFGFMEATGTVEAESGNEAAQREAERNDGCAYTTGPCVQRGKHMVHFLDEFNDWAPTSLTREQWGV